jgi:hypothetical protein
MSAWSIDIAYVKDLEVREILEEYHAQGVKAYDAGAYLGTLVACGAVLEGLLTWALMGRKEEATKAPGAHKDRAGHVLPLEKWNVSNLIDVAVSLGLLGPLAKGASWGVKEFRNLIHPYNIMRQSARADANLAINALSAVQEISRSIGGRVYQ